MRWLRKWFERRDQWNLSELSSWSEMGLSEPSASGITVTPSVALNVPAVYSCIQVLGQDVARATLKLRRKVAEDTYVDAVEHGLYEILASLANPETTAYSFKLSMMMDLLVYERAYAEIVRVDGRVTGLWRLDPTRMIVDRDASRRKRWRYGSTTWVFEASQPPILELSHPSPVRQCRDVIAHGGGARAVCREVLCEWRTARRHPAGERGDLAGHGDTPTRLLVRQLQSGDERA